MGIEWGLPVTQPPARGWSGSREGMQEGAGASESLVEALAEEVLAEMQPPKTEISRDPDWGPWNSARKVQAIRS